MKLILLISIGSLLTACSVVPTATEHYSETRTIRTPAELQRPSEAMGWIIISGVLVCAAAGTLAVYAPALAHLALASGVGGASLIGIGTTAKIAFAHPIVLDIFIAALLCFITWEIYQHFSSRTPDPSMPKPS